MYRYIALVWNCESASQEEAASFISLRLPAHSCDYSVALSRPGLLVLTADHHNTMGNYLLRRNCGVVLGSIFERNRDLHDDSPSDGAVFDAHHTDLVVASRGRALVANYWGNYVAILSDDQSRSVLILKDPTGSLPCFITSWRGVSIIFSCLQDCLEMGVLCFTVNWSYVTARLASNGADGSHNPLNEVSEIRRGECLEIGADGLPAAKRKLYWDPMQFCEPANTIDDVEAAARALRACVRSASHTLARGHSDILLRLSGGLDSSIVAGCLKDVASKSRIMAYTHFNPRGRSDERRWARLSATHAGFEHIECPCDPAGISLEPALQMGVCFEPPHVVGSVVRGGLEMHLAEERPYSATFSGDGGDSGFGAEGVRHVVDDFLRLRGLSVSVLNFAAAVALRTDTLAWRVLTDALLRHIRGSRMEDFRHRFVNKQSLAAKQLQNEGLRSKHFPHPWFIGVENVPWHVIRRVGALILTPEFYDPMRRSNAPAPLEIAPLYSQPVIELSLRVPLYVHFHQGIERGLARKAFAADAPAPVLRRLWKDRVPGNFETLAHHNRAFFRETVLGGRLAESGLIDCATIEAILGGEISKGGYFIGELFGLLDLELWIRHFTNRDVRRAAA
jgi:asparagine synthase (glutamine-hydrolysing)